MIKCEVVKEFTLGKFEELKNIKRRNQNTKGKLFVGDTFECDKEMVDYLMGNNKKNETVVKVIEVIPEVKEDTKIECKDEEVEKLFKETTKKSKKKKHSKK